MFVFLVQISTHLFRRDLSEKMRKSVNVESDQI